MRRFFFTCAFLVPFCTNAQFSEQHVIDFTELPDNSSGKPWSGDIDGDGDLDVFLDGVWFPNRGDGTFFPRKEVTSSFVSNFFTVLVDLDQDGDLDVVGGGQVNSSAQVYWLENDGAGDFGPIQIIGDVFDAGDFRSLLVVDVDDDGDLDVFSGNQTQDIVVWHENLGDELFAPWQLIASVDWPTTISAADLDADGDLDIVVGGSDDGGQAWYRNDGDGVFVPVISSALGFGAWTTACVGDINGDGYLDIIGDDNTSPASIYLNDGAGQFTLNGSVSSTELYGPQLVDAEGDGDLDLLAADLNGVRWWINDGSGVFTEGGEVLARSTSSFDLADVNGDGLVDLVFRATQYASIWYPVVGYCNGIGGGGFGSEFLFVDQTDDIACIIVADLDGDGLNDVVKAASNTDKITWFRNEGINGFSVGHVVTTLADGTRSVHAVDMDGDGDLDLVFGRSNANNVAWCSNDGAGVFSSPNSIGIGSEDVLVHVADFDGDGDQDFVSHRYYNIHPVRYYRNEGNGTCVLAFLGSALCSKSRVSDVDNDGDMDIVSGHDSIHVFLNQGNGEFVNGPVVGGGGLLDLELIDYDDDGHRDIAYLSYNGDLYWSRNQGDGTFGVTPLLVSNLSMRTFIVGDVDGDGLEDIVYSDYEDLWWCRNLGSAQFATPVLIGTAANILAFGDMDGDGDRDVLKNTAPHLGDLVWYENMFNSGDRIEGIVFHDLNSDGVRTPGEPGIAGLAVNVSPGIPALINLDEGHYSAFVEQGSYAVNVNVDPSHWSITTPVPINVEVTAVTPVVTGVDVGISPIVDITSLIPSLTLASAVCGSTTTLWLSVANEGTRVENCEFVFTLDPLFTFVSSYPIPTSVSGDTYRWSLDALPLFGSHTIQLVVNMPTVAQIGNAYELVLDVISLDENDLPQQTFVTQLVDTVTCSYDPNDKLVDPRGYGVHGAVEIDRHMLDYTIRFQNTGNAPAQTVLLRDPLDPILDPTSIQLLGSSHPISQFLVNESGDLLVRFDDIQLPGMTMDTVGSQGFVRFRVRPEEGAVEHLSTAHNDARIFFDLNEPVYTNTTVTTWVDCAFWQPQCTVFNLDSLVADSGDVYQWFRDGELLPGADGRTLVIDANGGYAVQVTSVYGCVATSPIVTVSGVGVLDHDALRMVLQPNPFTHQTRLFLSEPLTSVDRIDIVDPTGTLVRTLQGTGSAVVYIDRGLLASGVYMLRILRNGHRRVAVRMIVE